MTVYRVTLDITLTRDRMDLIDPPDEWSWPTIIDEPGVSLFACVIVPEPAHVWYRNPGGMVECDRCGRDRDIDHDDPRPCPGEIDPADPIPGGAP